MRSDHREHPILLGREQLLKARAPTMDEGRPEPCGVELAVLQDVQDVGRRLADRKAAQVEGGVQERTDLGQLPERAQ